MSLLPNDPKVRKVINDAIEQCVQAKIVQDDKASYIADTAEMVLDKTEMPKVEFNRRVAIRYKQTAKPAKYEEEKEWADVAYEENEILNKSK